MEGKILVVDDDPVFLSAVVSLFQLKLPAVVVHTAPCGDQALQVIQAGGYDLIIADWRMPRMDGLEFLKVAKSASPSTPIVLLTGQHDEKMIETALCCGAHAVLQKPVDRLELVEQTKNALVGRR